MKVEHITKKFENKMVISDFSCEIPDGKITYLMGASGIGKTTLLRIIAGLDTNFSGKIIKSGTICTVFQEPRLFPTLTVKENICIVSDEKKEIQDILECLEISNCKNMLPAELSGGMKMRVSIARALYADGDIYLMDEPFSSIDENMRERIIPVLFRKLSGKTVLIVSHNSDEAKKYADKIIAM